MWADSYLSRRQSAKNITHSGRMWRATWPIYRFPEPQISMVYQGICAHRLRNWRSQCCEFWEVRKRISWSKSPRMDETGSQVLRGGCGVVYGWGNTRISMKKQELISWRFYSRHLLWRDKEVGYSRNSPTCLLRWIWPKWPKDSFHAPR